MRYYFFSSSIIFHGIQRSNYTEPKFSIIGENVDSDGAGGGGGSAKDRMRSTISDKKRKSSTNVRRILLYRKNLNTLIDEFVRSPNLIRLGPY